MNIFVFMKIFRLATHDESGRIMVIIEQAKAQMRNEGKHQWTESYPSLRDVEYDIDHQGGYVMTQEDGVTVIAYGAVYFSGEKAYNDLDGKWLSDLPYVVVHRLAVADEVKKQGVATLFMEEVCHLSLSKGVRSFRIDTNFDNIYMQKILLKLGFTYCGDVTYPQGYRMAYEKLLNV